jgi:flagellar motor switch protein FliM
MADTTQQPPNDQDAAAAEWAAMLENDQNAGAGEPATGERVLNQDEIDTLLGFDGAKDTGNNNSGIHAILDKSLMAYERLPMIEVVFDRLVRMMSSSLRNFTSDNVDVSIDSMVSMRFEDYLNSIPLPAMLVVCRAVEWENFGLITVDSSQIYSTVDVLLGGRRSNRPIRIEGRPYTTIEQDIVKRMVDVVLADMSVAFDPLSPVSFVNERLESNPRFATITRPSNPVLLIRMRVDMEERGGHIEIVLPHNTLEPIRDQLLQMFIGEKFGQDKQWENHIGGEVRQTLVDVEVLLNEKPMSLAEVLQFKVGTTILLDCEAEDPVSVRCGGVEVCTAQVGRVGDTIAVSLNDQVRSKTVQEQAQLAAGMGGATTSNE